MASPTWWIWAWVISGNWWWTGRPGVLWFMGSQRVEHDWMTELNWTSFNCLSEQCQLGTMFSCYLEKSGTAFEWRFKTWIHFQKGRIIFLSKPKFLSVIPRILISYSCFWMFQTGPSQLTLFSGKEGPLYPLVWAHSICGMSLANISKDCFRQITQSSFGNGWPRRYFLGYFGTQGRMVWDTGRKESKDYGWLIQCSGLYMRLFATAKIRKQPKCPSTGKSVKKMWSIYTMECYSVITKMKFFHLQQHGLTWRALPWVK